MRHLLWLDLETTGLDEDAGEILEVATVITDLHLREVGGFNQLIRTKADVSTADARAKLMPFKVQQMHHDSGLWADLAAARENVSLMDIREVDSMLYRFLCDTFGQRTRITLAGAGVATFDFRWMRKHMPFTWGQLTYYTLDTSVLRRFLMDLCGVDLDDGEPVGHRSMQDVQMALAFARIWQHRLEAAFAHHGEPSGGEG